MFLRFLRWIKSKIRSSASKADVFLPEHPLCKELDIQVASALRPFIRRPSTLPPEILVEIFLLSLPPITHAQASQRTTLALVCHRWNAVIESNPILWFKISVADSSSYARKSLLKSGEAPIDVCGLVVPSSTPSPDTLLFLQEVRDRSQRWRHVAIGPWNLPSLTIHYPLLESIQLHGCPKEHEEYDVATLLDVTRTPNLREMVVDELVFTQWDFPFRSSLSKLVLRTVKHSCPSSSQLLSILAACPNLTVVHFQDITCWRGDDECADDCRNAGVVELPALQELTLDGLGGDLVRDLLTGLKFPSECAVVINSRPDGCPGPSFLVPTLSSFRETLQINQVTLRLGNLRDHLIVQAGRWSIGLHLQSEYGILDALDWFGIGIDSSSTNDVKSRTPLTPADFKASNIPITLEIDHDYSLHYLDNIRLICDLESITRVTITRSKSDEAMQALSYLSTRDPRIGDQQPTATSNSKFNERVGLIYVWPFLGLCELAFGQVDEDNKLVNAVIDLVKARSSSSSTTSETTTGGLARLKRVEFGTNCDTFHPWPKTLLRLLDMLDREAQVIWYGRRILNGGILN